MDGVNVYIIVSAITVAAASVLLNLTGRQKYKDNAGFFESANNELREQNATLRQENTQYKTDLAKTQAESTQKDKTIEQLKPFSEVVTTMSNNHTQVMTALSDVASKITGKVQPSGRKRTGRQKPPTRV